MCYLFKHRHPNSPFDLQKDLKFTRHKVWQVLTCNSFYNNLQVHYSLNTSIAWIIFGSCMDETCNSWRVEIWGKVYGKKGFTLGLHCREWLILNYVVNATRGSLFRFYIFRGEGLKNSTSDITNHGHVWWCKQNNGWIFLI